MNKQFNISALSGIGLTVLLLITIFGCVQDTKNFEAQNEGTDVQKPEYFLLRPDLEKMYGYTQAVKVGNIVKIGGVISK